MLRAALIAIALTMTMAPTDFAAAAEKKRDQDQVRGVMKQQKLIPYGEIARRVQSRFKGRIVGQELRQYSRERWVYELKILKIGGQVVSVLVDAHSGQILGSRGRR
jgi:uncharacterized membrane protein YkoI